MMMMMKNCSMVMLLCLLIIPRTGSTEEQLTLELSSAELMKTGSDLEQAETKDAKASEIVKQIRRVNADGTYTLGFETDDGSFKIETRDVMGNVKQGTYGYIDENGDVKRVLYSTNNETLPKDTTPEVVEIVEEEKETITPAHSFRYNRTNMFSTTRRPSSLSYLTSTAGPTKASVIQSIPRKRILLPSERTTSRGHSDAPRSFDSTTTVVYATSVPTPKPFTGIRSTTYASKNDRSTKVEIDQISSKVFISSSKEVSTTKPNLSKDKSDEKHTKHEGRGNILRRQLKQDDEGFEAQQQVLYGQSGGEDGASGIYGGGYGSVRPLFTTTSQPRVPLQVLAARQRANQLQSVLANSVPSSTTEKSYVKIPKRQGPIKVKVEEVTESAAENNFLTQVPIADQIPGSLGPEDGLVNDPRGFRERPLQSQLDQLYRPRNYLRQVQLQQQQLLQQPQQQQSILADPRAGFRLPPPQQPQQQQQQIPNEQLLSERPDLRQTTQSPQGAQRFTQQYQSLQSQQQQPQPNYSDQPAESYLSPSPYYPPRTPYDYDRPLTVRDFERLLQMLVFRQQQFRYNPYYPPTNPASFPPFVPSPYNNQPYSQIPRPPPFYNPANPLSTGLYDPNYQNPYYSPSSPVSQYSPGGQGNNDGMFPLSPQQQQTLGDASSYDSQRLIPRRRQQQQQQQQFDPRLFQQGVGGISPNPSEQEFNYNALQSTDQSYLPSSVREQLLYRMLMLAIRNDPQFVTQAAASSSDSHTVLEPEQQEAINILKKVSTTKNKTIRSNKPVRSVQIIGVEEEEDEEATN